MTAYTRLRKLSLPAHLPALKAEWAHRDASALPPHPPFRCLRFDKARD